MNISAKLIEATKSNFIKKGCNRVTQHESNKGSLAILGKSKNKVKYSYGLTSDKVEVRKTFIHKNNLMAKLFGSKKTVITMLTGTDGKVTDKTSERFFNSKGKMIMKKNITALPNGETTEVAIDFKKKKKTTTKLDAAGKILSLSKTNIN